MSVSFLILLPFIGAVITFIAGKLYKKSAFWFAEIIGFTLFGVSLVLFFNFSAPISLNFNWFEFGNFSVPFGLYIDHLSLVMLLIATGLGALDIHFAHDYMKEDPDQARYYAKVLFFIGGMILLVTAKEMIGLFVGWEFMGLASYLLISFWHYNKAPADAGVAAFLYTRFGDIFLFAAIGLLFFTTQTLDLMQINHLASSHGINKHIGFIIAVFIFIAAIGKSGQFPLFPWLMRAMEGPTTVSALIHGATMVNSGIYIVARLFDFYVAMDALIVVAGVGALSAFIGATSALVQREMKKVLAYSTMSHLSLAFIGLGVGSLAAGMTHLTNHAIFKALLFLGAGAVIMSTHHTKDMFKLGGLGKKMGVIAFVMAMGGLSLSGIPPFSGFHSKDAILATALVNPQSYGLISTLTLIAGVLSIAYIGRLWLLIFSSEARDKEIYQHVKAPSFVWIAFPLLILSFITFAMGFYQEQLAHYLTGVVYEIPHISGFTGWLLSALALVALIVYYFYYKRPDKRDKIAAQPLMKSIHGVLFNGYYIEAMITWFAKNIVVQTVAKSVNWSDKKVIDGAVNKSVPLSRSIFQLFNYTIGSTSGAQAGGMILGAVTIVLIAIIGGIQ